MYILTILYIINEVNMLYLPTGNVYLTYIFSKMIIWSLKDILFYINLFSHEPDILYLWNPMPQMCWPLSSLD